MPVVNISVVERIFSREQKNRLISEITDLMYYTRRRIHQAKTLVLIEEIKSGNWGIDGMGMTTEAIQAKVALIKLKRR